MYTIGFITVKFIVLSLATLSTITLAIYGLKSLYTHMSLKYLSKISYGDLDSYPLLSVIIPACNEAATLENSIKTICEEDYPHIEILLINDRSSDRTGEIIDFLAEQNEKIIPIHIDTLPEGWLGKVHALKTGYEKSKGEWVLFTDADVHYKKGTLRKSISLCVRENIDHLALGPKIISAGLFMESLIYTFFCVFLDAVKAHKIGKPGSDAFIGVGAFNLVRRSKFEETEGFPWLKMEVADDVGVGLLMKNAGAKGALFIADKELSIFWYPSISAMVKGLEKNSFGVLSGFRLWVLPLFVIFYLALFVSPWVCIFYLPWSLALIPPIITTIALSLPCFVICKNSGYNYSAILFIQITYIFLLYIIIRSAYAFWKNKGIIWRGTLYDTRSLIQGRRVKL